MGQFQNSAKLGPGAPHRGASVNRTLILALVASVAVGGYLLVNPPVDLQPSSPGTIQAGHINISGRVLAGSVGATDPAGTAQVISGNATHTSGANFGGLFKTSSSNGTGVRGVATSVTGAANGGTFQTASSNGAGVRGYATSLSGTNYGVYGKAAGPSSFAGFFDGRLQATSFLGNGTALTNLNASALVTGIVPDTRLSANVPRIDAANVFSGSNSFLDLARFIEISLNPSLGAITFTGNSSGYMGILPGLYPSLVIGNGGVQMHMNTNGTLSVGPPTSSTWNSSQRMIVHDNVADSIAVFRARNGYGIAGIGSARRGMLSEADGTGPTTGVYATAQSTNSVTYGVEAYASGTGPNYALYSYAGNGTANWAGWFAGTIYAVSATSGIKAFLIDHPLDPENKFLEHSSVESDERMNLYRGVVTTDARGYATLHVPNWFTALNEDIQYQLTVIDEMDSDGFAMAKVVQEIREDAFKIRTSVGNAKVNWMVTGRRHDPTSNYYPLQVEREKLAGERGKYLVPEAFGKDQSHAMAQGTRDPERTRGIPAARGR